MSPRIAHSLAEAYLYLMATPCDVCGMGPLRGADAEGIEGSDADPLTVTICVTCGECGSTSVETFELPNGAGLAPNQPAVVNPGTEPSRIIDVAQWITLFRVITEAASRETDKVQARCLGMEAAQCLDEALRFFSDVDSDLPPPDALFSEPSRERMRKHPEQFSRQRLLALRSKLPTMSAYLSDVTRRKEKKWWWRR